MLCIFVNEAFEDTVNTIAEARNLPIRLGSRLIDNGEHSGERLVTCNLFNSCIEWQTLIKQFASGGTALENGQFTIEEGRTVEFTDPTGTVWGPYTIQYVDTTGMFNEETAL